MNKLQKIAMCFTIFFCLNYALDILLNFHVIMRLLTQYPWLEKLYAFLTGICGFLDILVFQKDRDM